MLALGFSSGLPFLLIFGTLSAWLREANISRTDIGLMSYVGLAYTIKFLWAPLIDQVRVPVLGRLLGQRRAWMLVAQAAIAGSLVAISFCDPTKALIADRHRGRGAGLLRGDAGHLHRCLAHRGRARKPSRARWRPPISSAFAWRSSPRAPARSISPQFVSWHVAYLAMAVLMGLGVVAVLLAPRVESQTAAGAAAKTMSRAP